MDQPRLVVRSEFAGGPAAQLADPCRLRVGYIHRGAIAPVTALTPPRLPSRRRAESTGALRVCEQVVLKSVKILSRKFENRIEMGKVGGPLAGLRNQNIVNLSRPRCISYHNHSKPV